MILPLVISIVVLAVFLAIDTKSPIISNVFLFILFLFLYANSPHTSVSTFYLFGILFTLIISITKQTWAAKTYGEELLTKWKFPIVGIALGIGIFIFMRLLQSRAGVSIIGVPTLSISSTVGKYAMPAMVGVLGIVENRLFFSMFELLSMAKIFNYFRAIPLLLIFAPIMPVVLIAAGFAIFHLSAYSLALSSLLFAFMVFALWVGVYIWRRDDVAPNVAHFLWNTTIALSKTLKVI